jgi:dTDP-4-amino-4,6-dideoxygalactose transaminase
MVTRRREAAARYRTLLAGIEQIRLPVEPAWGGHVYQSFVVLLDEGVDRDAIMRVLAEHGIETTLGTYALHREPFFRRTFGYRPGDLPGSDAAFRRSLALPMYAGLEEDNQAYVADRLRAALAAGRAPVS